MIMRKFTESKMEKSSEILLIPFDYQEKESFRKIANYKKYRFVLHPQYLSAGQDQLGHWVMNVLDKDRSRIYVFNSQPDWSVNRSILKEIFTDCLCFIVKGIPKQNEMDCAYHYMFYEFMICLVTKSIDEFEKFLQQTAHLMNDFKLIVDSFTQYCRRQTEKYYKDKEKQQQK